MVEKEKISIKDTEKNMKDLQNKLNELKKKYSLTPVND
jgi:hypothetical protein